MASSSSYNICTIRRHRRDIQRAIERYLDPIIDECFLQGVISSEAYRQVISCDESKALEHLFIAIQRGITRRAESYHAFVRILQDVLPRESSKDLLDRLETTRRQLKSVEESGDMFVRRSSSEPSMSRVHSTTFYTTSHSLTEGQATPGELEPTMGGRGQEANGGLHFSSDPHHPGACNGAASLVGTGDEYLVEAVQELGINGDIGGGDRDEFSAAVEESRENGDHPSNLKQRRSIGRQSQQNAGPRPQVHPAEASGYNASGIFDAVTLLHHSRLECQQRQAEIVVLNGEVRNLRGQLATAHEKNERLTLKVQRQLENKETLRRKLHRQISALRDEAQRSKRNDERQRTQVAELEVDRYALREKVRRITAQYEPKIRDLENARSRLQKQISTNEAEIPRLQNVILRKEERIQELGRSRYSRKRLAVVVFLSLLLVAFLLFLVSLLCYLLGYML